jgi:hypothetical protein
MNEAGDCEVLWFEVSLKGIHQLGHIQKGIDSGCSMGWIGFRCGCGIVVSEWQVWHGEDEAGMRDIFIT